MKVKALTFVFGVLVMGALITGCFQMASPALSEQGAPARAKGQPGGSGGHGGGKGGGGGEESTETAVNNLSFPVFWADQALPIGENTAEVSSLSGEWVYWAGLDNDDNPIVFPFDTVPVDPAWKKGFLQQDPENVWTADARYWSEFSGQVGEKLVVDLIDWGDNLESQDWTTTSMVRTEVVLYKDLSGVGSLNGYEMLHVVGLGVDEMHGLSVAQETAETAGTTDAQRAVSIQVPQPIVYSDHARLTIQKLNFDRTDVGQSALLSWHPGTLDDLNDPPCWVSVGADETDLGLVDAPLFNSAVDDASGPGAYSAEINIKGRIVYGYTWNVAEFGVEEGDYRITFSLDGDSGAAFEEQTHILETSEEAVAALAAQAAPAVGGNAAVVPDWNLSYIDIHLRARGGGGGGRGQGGGGGHAGNGGA